MPGWFSPSEAYLALVIPPEVKIWNNEQGSVTSGANPTPPCPTAAFTTDEHKQGVHSSQDQVYCSCSRRHVVESIAREMLREAAEELVTESTTNCLWGKKTKKQNHKQLLIIVYYCSQ